MSYVVFMRRALIVGAIMLGAAAPAPAAAPGYAALSDIARGEWIFHPSRGTGPSMKLCVQDPRRLIQLRHQDRQCTRYVIENEPDRVTVHYTCPGAGYGRTTVRVETRSLVQVRSEGIANNAPFSLSLEGRHHGSCG